MLYANTLSSSISLICWLGAAVKIFHKEELLRFRCINVNIILIIAVMTFSLIHTNLVMFFVSFNENSLWSIQCSLPFIGYGILCISPTSLLAFLVFFLFYSSRRIETVSMNRVAGSSAPVQIHKTCSSVSVGV